MRLVTKATLRKHLRVSYIEFKSHRNGAHTMDVEIRSWLIETS